AGGGAIVGADPLRVAAEDEDPFALLDAVPRLAADAVAARADAARVDAACAYADDADDADGAVGGGWFGWLGYRLAARVERVPLNPRRPVALPEFHLAYYDNVLRRTPDGRWWFEALVTDARREALRQ